MLLCRSRSPATRGTWAIHLPKERRQRTRGAGKSSHTCMMHYQRRPGLFTHTLSSPRDGHPPYACVLGARAVNTNRPRTGATLRRSCKGTL
ncbi:unnamed protein product [Boreogadus saida]